VNAQQRQPLAALFGAADVSNSDGQHFPAAGPGEAVGAVNAHYERTASVLFYTHLSARQAPYHTVAIPPSGEAAYVIDGLLYHEADLSIATHHTDGGAVSDHNFALAYLLGFYFAPRIPNLAERRLYTFGPTSAWPVLEPFIAGRVDEKLITTHWNDVLRLATSVRTGTVSASLLLKRLGAYPRQNGLALALREIGRIERTLFMLDWLELPGLRRQATVELNKGEAPTPSPALSVSTASAGCAIVRSRRSNTVRAGLPSSPPLSRSGTPYISTVRSMTCVAAGK